MENQQILIASLVGGALVIVLLIFLLRRPRKKNPSLSPAEQDLFAERYFEDDILSTPRGRGEKLDKKTKTPTRNLTKMASEKPPKSFEEPQLIVVLRVIANSQQKFSGADIFAVLEDLGMNYGEMHIFHHYGVGEMKVKKSVFSVANVVEPGVFDPRERDNFTSPGLAFFMQLPGPLGGRVAFELMLNTAQRVADVLEGTLIDEREQLLTSESAIELRDRIAQFERRPAVT
jgi:cell division protein ZipA